MSSFVVEGGFSRFDEDGFEFVEWDLPLLLQIMLQKYSVHLRITLLNTYPPKSLFQTLLRDPTLLPILVIVEDGPHPLISDNVLRLNRSRQEFSVVDTLPPTTVRILYNLDHRRLRYPSLQKGRF
jgi:hypothetical protein